MPQPTYDVTACRGTEPDGCRNGLGLSRGFAQEVTRTIEASGWPEFLQNNITGKIGHHHRLRASVAACANGCSRPHIVDIGFIAAEYPVVMPERCIGCGKCVRACPDQAISPQDDVVSISGDLCLGCGTCIRVCEQSALVPVSCGFRVVVGGKLGRRPRLGQELPGVFSREEALGVLAKVLRFMMDNYAHGRNLGTILEKIGEGRLRRDGIVS
jgi:dissimilatory sulfite reductase (desulfoviridin) alpha/beta subunit